MEVRIDDLEGGEIAELLAEHHREMFRYSPPESVHALDPASLKSPDVTFWGAWEGGELLGCGALKELAPGHGEVKSMRTAAAHLRKGVAKEILRAILEEAAARSYARASLETGSGDAFAPARKLYEGFGFAYCGPFGDYVLDPFSVFMTKELSTESVAPAG